MDRGFGPSCTHAEHLDGGRVIPNPFGRSIYTIRHTRNAAEYPPAMRAAIAETYTNWSKLDVEVETLLAEPYTRRQYTDVFVPALMGPTPERKVDQTDRGYKSMITRYGNTKDKMVAEWGAAGQVGSEGTKWHALMGVNSFELWGKGVKNATRQERQVPRAIRIEEGGRSRSSWHRSSTASPATAPRRSPSSTDTARKHPASSG